MKPQFSHRRQTSTAFVLLDTGKCKACWKCQEICSNQVIGRINLPWHKHARIIMGDNCTGCLKCIKVCEHKALSRILMVPKNHSIE